MGSTIRSAGEMNTAMEKQDEDGVDKNAQDLSASRCALTRGNVTVSATHEDAEDRTYVSAKFRF